MIGYLEDKFWNNLIGENMPAIELLVKDNFDAAAFKLMCCLIDSLSGFYSPNEKPNERFNNFMKKYMPNFFNQVDFGDKIRLRSKENKPINFAGDILYEAFISCSIHDGALGLGIGLYRDKNYDVLWSGEGIDIVKINIIGLLDYLKKAIKDFENDIKNNNETKDNFKKRFNKVWSPVFKSNEKANQYE